MKPASLVCGLLVCGSLVCAAVAASPAAAQTSAAAATPGEAAAHALYEFCLPLFGPGAVHADRISATASMAALTPAPRSAAPLGLPRPQAAFTVPAPAGSRITAFWISEPTVCQIIILGPPGAGLDLLESLTPTGWTLVQQGVSTGPDTAGDAWIAQPRGYDQELVLVANRWISETPPQGGVRLVINLMHAQP